MTDPFLCQAGKKNTLFKLVTKENIGEKETKGDMEYRDCIFN
jgi:hypothetical protein